MLPESAHAHTLPTPVAADVPRNHPSDAQGVPAIPVAAEGAGVGGSTAVVAAGGELSDFSCAGNAASNTPIVSPGGVPAEVPDVGVGQARQPSTTGAAARATSRRVTADEDFVNKVVRVHSQPNDATIHPFYFVITYVNSTSVRRDNRPQPPSQLYCRVLEYLLLAV